MAGSIVEQFKEGLRQALAGKSVRGVVVAFLVIAAVGLFLLPVPRALLDLLLVVNIVLSLTILLRSMLMTESIQLQAFPILLVLTTLFRLSLNVSSARRILLYGDKGTDVAGLVIRAFGDFVVGGDFAVGALIFTLIAVVNFIVITKGSARVAEVAARFTLDAMPGRQLAIDSDLRSGLISREEAQARRMHLSHESHFYGAMDGAMRFVQGDAIACLIIAFMNSVGGIAIGLGRGLTFSQAMATFGVLAVGDGLVSIIPSLLISVSAGVVVTNVSRRDSAQSTGSVVASIFTDIPSLLLAALSILVFGCLPGFPFFPFFLVGIVVLAGAFWMQHQRIRVAASERFAAAKDAGGGARTEGVSVSPRNEDAVVPLVIEVGPELAAECLWDARRGESPLLEAYARRRAETYRSRGVYLPQPAVSERTELSPREYHVLVRGALVHTGSIQRGAVFAAAPSSLVRVWGGGVLRAGFHPISGASASWAELPTSVRESLVRAGVEILDSGEYLALAATGAALRSIDELFGLDETKALIAEVERAHPRLTEEIFGGRLLSSSECAVLLRRLLQDRINIRDMKLILEGAAEFACRTPAGDDRAEWLENMHAHLRLVLWRTILSDALGPDETLRVFVLSPSAEEELRSAVSVWEGGRAPFPLAPEIQSALCSNAAKLFGPALERGSLPIVVLCSADVRDAADAVLAEGLGSAESLRTLAYEELRGGFRSETVGALTI